MNDLQLETPSTHHEPIPAPPALTPRDSRSLRAYRHGLTGQIILLTEADRIAYANHCQGFFKSLAPQGAIQNNLCQAIADDRWRLQRAASLESAIFAAEITEPDKLVTGDAEVDTTLAMGRAPPFARPSESRARSSSRRSRSPRPTRRKQRRRSRSYRPHHLRPF